MKVWAASLVWLIGFSLAHLSFLPFVITFDGHMYLDQADMLGTERFFTEWDFLRQPLYPFLLKMSFGVFGKSALSAAAVGWSLGVLGVLVLGLTARIAAGPALGGATIFLSSLYPYLISYEHCALTETGTFLFLALITFFLVSLVRGAMRPVWAVAGLILSLTLGYYHRAPVGYLGPVVALFVVIYLVSRTKDRKRWFHALCFAVALIAVPYALMMPWRLISAKSGRMEEILFQRIVKQVLLPPDDPLIAEKRDEYMKAIRQSRVDGKLTVSGIGDGSVYPLAEYLQQKHRGEVKAIFGKVLREYPGRYFAALWRTGLMYAGVRGQESDNAHWLRFAVADFFPTINPGLPHLQEKTVRDFSRKIEHSPLGTAVGGLEGPFVHIMQLGLVLTIVGFVWGALKRRWEFLALGVVPLTYLGMLWVGLFSIDRYPFPAYPMLIANVLLLPALWFGFNAADKVIK